MEEHYRPRDIVFDRQQVLWLIEWLELLQQGSWPPDPRETGYTEAPKVQTSPSTRAPFEGPVQVAAEVTSRLESCGDAGQALRHEVEHGLTAYELLSPPARRALNYCCGVNRRRETFARWCWKRDNRTVKEVEL